MRVRVGGQHVENDLIQQSQRVFRADVAPGFQKGFQINASWNNAFVFLLREYPVGLGEIFLMLAVYPPFTSESAIITQDGDSGLLRSLQNRRLDGLDSDGTSHSKTPNFVLDDSRQVWVVRFHDKRGRRAIYRYGKVVVRLGQSQNGHAVRVQNGQNCLLLPPASDCRTPSSPARKGRRSMSSKWRCKASPASSVP